MTVTEITERMEQVRKNITTNKNKLDQLRVERGQLSIENSKANAQSIARLDVQIEDVRKDVENGPIELRILGENLTKEQERLAQEARDELLNQQKEVATTVEQLSQELIVALGNTLTINEKLLPTLSAYNSLREKTGADVLGSCCQGSRGWLRAVYEICENEMQGQPRPNNIPPIPI